VTLSLLVGYMPKFSFIIICFYFFLLLDGREMPISWESSDSFDALLILDKNEKSL
jgi:hypothetical protein